MSVAHPGFSSGERHKEGSATSANVLFGLFFAENYIKMKKNGTRGVARHWSLLDPECLILYEFVNFGSIICTEEFRLVILSY